jgi:hypothetical protein
MVQGDPVFMRRINGWLAVLWIVMIPISVAMHWLDKVQYVSALSIWALVSGHWSAWQAARVEVNQQEQASREQAPGGGESAGAGDGLERPRDRTVALQDSTPFPESVA